MARNNQGLPQKTVGMSLKCADLGMSYQKACTPTLTLNSRAMTPLHLTLNFKSEQSRRIFWKGVTSGLGRWGSVWKEQTDFFFSLLANEERPLAPPPPQQRPPHQARMRTQMAGGYTATRAAAVRPTADSETEIGRPRRTLALHHSLSEPWPQ